MSLESLERRFIILLISSQVSVSSFLYTRLVIKESRRGMMFLVLIRNCYPAVSMLMLTRTAISLIATSSHRAGLAVAPFSKP